MRTLLSIIGGVVVAAGMLAVIAAGIWYDSVEYARRQKEKEKKDED